MFILGFALFMTLLGSFLYCFQIPQKIACSWRFLIPVTALCREGSITFRMLAICKDKHIEKRNLHFPFFSDMTAAAVMFDVQLEV